MHQVWPLRGGRGVCASSALNPRAARRLCSHRAATSDVRAPGSTGRPAFPPPPPHTHPHDPPRLTPPLPLRSAALLPGGEPSGCLSSEARTVRGLRLAAAERFGTDNIQSWRETSSVTTALVFTQPRPQPASDVGAGARQGRGRRVKRLGWSLPPGLGAPSQPGAASSHVPLTPCRRDPAAHSTGRWRQGRTRAKRRPQPRCSPTPDPRRVSGRTHALGVSITLLTDGASGQWKSRDRVSGLGGAGLPERAQAQFPENLFQTMPQTTMRNHECRGQNGPSTSR